MHPLQLQIWKKKIEDRREKRIETILGIVLKGLVLGDAIPDDNRIESSFISCHCIHLDNHGVASFDNLWLSLMNCPLSFEILMWLSFFSFKLSWILFFRLTHSGVSDTLKAFSMGWLCSLKKFWHILKSVPQHEDENIFQWD